MASKRIEPLCKQETLKETLIDIYAERCPFLVAGDHTASALRTLESIADPAELASHAGSMHAKQKTWGTDQSQTKPASVRAQTDDPAYTQIIERRLSQVEDVLDTVTTKLADLAAQAGTNHFKHMKPSHLKPAILIGRPCCFQR
jgi:hypothetical protein